MFIREFGPLRCDLGPIKERVSRLPQEAWKFRGDPESYKTKVVREGSSYFPYAEIETVLSKVPELVESEGYTNRVVLSCVPNGEAILPHRDDFGEDVRSKSIHCHLPIITGDGAVMGFPNIGVEVHMEEGVVYALDETEAHYVRNESGLDRVHLLFAFFPHKGKESLN